MTQPKHWLSVPYGQESTFKEAGGGFEEFGGPGLTVQLVSPFLFIGLRGSLNPLPTCCLLWRDEKEAYVKAGLCGLNSMIVNKYFISFIL